MVEFAGFGGFGQKQISIRPQLSGESMFTFSESTKKDFQNNNKSTC